MKSITQRKDPGGYVSLIGVFTISIFMLALLMFAYNRALDTHSLNADIQTHADYREKEETILRSIVAITPNRAIRAMQDGSDSTPEKRDPLTWESIFSEAIDQSNARQSISPGLLEKLDIPQTFNGNSGDSALGTVSRIFRPVAGNTGLVSAALNRDLGEGFPPSLNSTIAITDDDIYPIISDEKRYGSFAVSAYNSQRLKLDPTKSENQKFNLIRYPQIKFGYAKPGDFFVAKRNAWAFTMDIASHDDSITQMARFKRSFVLSLYEIPSQLPISAGSFMAIGSHADGAAWQNVTISGNIHAGRAVVEGATSIPGLVTRRGSTMSLGSTVGGTNFTGNPFAPGVRENYQLTQGDFFPVSLASEGGKSAFVSINRGADYFDRHAHLSDTSMVSPTGWNDYSVGALQCAMTLDITRCVSVADRTPTELKFTYMMDGTRQTLIIPLDAGVAENLPVGYIQSVAENNSATFDTPVDVAYGANGQFYYKQNVSGTVSFDNQTFGDPSPGINKYGYYKPRYPFGIKYLPSGKICVAVYPERFTNFMAMLGVTDLVENNSLAVNVDYINSTTLTKPIIPCVETGYGVVLQECGDLTSFPDGFSLVTNLRLYIGDDFNVVPTAPPPGYTPPAGTNFYPPCSLFAPEKRYGVDFDPFGVDFNGQVGSVAADNIVIPVRPLDATGVSGSSMDASDININLSTISHPAVLPPITMMNWLIVLEEKRKEFY